MRAPSVRTVIAAAAVIPIVVVAIALVVLFSLTGRRISEQLGASLIADATARVESDLRAFLSHAVRTSDLYTRRILDGSLPIDDLGAWETDELHDLLTTPDVASICFGAADGSATWLLRAHGRLELGRVTRGNNDAAVEFVRDPAGPILPEPIRVYHYDPRERPWYRLALDHHRPIWTPIYFWFGDAGADSETGAGYTRAVRAPDGTLLGVLVIDVTLHGLSAHLKSLPVASTGFAYLIDDHELLVAASDGHVNSDLGERLLLSRSDSAPARAVAAAIAADQSAHFFRRLELEQGPARANITTLSPFPGINWRLVTVVPESAFLAEANALRARAVWISVLAAGGGVLLGVSLARLVSRPLIQLAGHIRRIGAGDFDARIDLYAAHELRELSDELNRMAGGLKERLALEQSLAVATQVQQSLLPHGAPDAPGLDIAGHIRYCDGTGGDYFDYIRLRPGGPTLIVIGDVMGHGIGAALLMATARASLRAYATSCSDLGQLLTRVNADLARDVHQGRFMTMLLLLVDPSTGTLRWASAGHDRPIVYDPAGRFIETEGGGIPLGVEAGAVYADSCVSGLAPGAVVAIGTDGVWEARKPGGEFFGKDRLRALVRDHARRPAAEIAAVVATALGAFLENCPFQDDATLVIVRLEPRGTIPQP
jgi:phosphoserine phosphatase RsbU/P